MSWRVVPPSHPPPFSGWRNVKIDSVNEAVRRVSHHPTDLVPTGLGVDVPEGTPALRICCTCKQAKSLDEYGRHKSGPGGLNRQCKACNRANALRHRAANRDRIEAGRRAKYRENPEPAKARALAYVRRNPEKVREGKRRQYSENREKRLAYMAEYRLRNPEKVREICRRAKAKRPEYYRMMSAAKTAVRRAREAAVQQVPFTAEQLAQRLAYYGNRCWMCGAPGTAIDHVKPIVKGGPNMLANLRPACKPCNGGKCGRWPFTPPRKLSA